MDRAQLADAKSSIQKVKIPVNPFIWSKAVKIMSKKGAALPPPEPAPPPIEDDNRKQPISIETFPRDSKKVIFTEYATLEALRRLGLSFADFNYRPPADFKRAGCDDSVTKLLYNKYEEKRQDMIRQVIEMRDKILEEKKIPVNGETALIRLEKRYIESEKKKLEDLQSKRNSDLRRLVVSQLRELYQKQFHVDAVEKTRSRIDIIEKMKNEMIRQAQIRAATLPPMEQKKPEPYVLPVDNAMIRYLQKKKEEEQKRKELAEQTEKKRQEAAERSTQILQQNMEKGEKKIQDKEERFLKWQADYAEKLQRKAEKAKERAAHEASVVENSIKLEEDRKQRWMTKINNGELRSRSASEVHNTEVKQRLDIIRQRVTERASKCKDAQVRGIQTRDEFRQKLEQTEREAQERLRKQSIDTQLKIVSKQFERETKVENIHHGFAAKEHMKQLQNKQTSNELTQVNKLEAERQKVLSKKTVEQNKYLSMREMIMNEFRNMDSPLDQKGLAKIQQLLGIEEEEMQSLIEQARNPPNLERLRRRPQTAASNNYVQSEPVPVAQKLPPMPAARPVTTQNKTRGKPK